MRNKPICGSPLVVLCVTNRRHPGRGRQRSPRPELVGPHPEARAAIGWPRHGSLRLAGAAVLPDRPVTPWHVATADAERLAWAVWCQQRNPAYLEHLWRDQAPARRPEVSGPAHATIRRRARCSHTGAATRIPILLTADS